MAYQELQLCGAEQFHVRGWETWRDKTIQVTQVSLSG
jgi:hypothetical protein